MSDLTNTIQVLEYWIANNAATATLAELRAMRATVDGYPTIDTTALDAQIQIKSDGLVNTSDFDEIIRAAQAIKEKQASIRPPKTVLVAGASALTKNMPIFDVTRPQYAIQCPTTKSGAFRLINESGSFIWNIGYPDLWVNGGATTHQGLVHLDSINQILYVGTFNENGNRFYLSSIDTNTGTVTQIGDVVDSELLPTIVASVVTQRETETSGDFTIIVDDNKIVISSTTGQVVSKTPLTINGLNASGGIGGISDPNGKYTLNTVFSTEGKMYMGADLVRSNRQTMIPLDVPSTLTAAQGFLKLWGGYIAISGMFYNDSSVYGQSFFDKDDLFRYVDEYLGY